MPRYFFDTDDGDLGIRDDEGYELPDDAAARREAMSALPDMARDKLPDGDRRTFSAVVKDATGRAIYSAVLSLEGGWIKEPSDEPSESYLPVARSWGILTPIARSSLRQPKARINAWTRSVRRGYAGA